VRLEQNYRSSQAILDAAYQVIRTNPERAEKRLWTSRAGGEKVMATQAYNEIEEAEFVADEIERLRKTEQRGYSDFAILYRTNAQSRSFEDVLARRRIPYRLVGGVRFWERREVKDVVAYLRFCFNPKDSISFGRIVSVPSRKIGSVTVDALSAFSRESDSDLLTLLADPARVPGLPRPAIEPLKKFRAQLESLRSVMGVLRPSELPHQRALDEHAENPSLAGAATEMAEERRLCYVGMTRAKDRLYLSCAFRRHLYGRSQPAFPSRFLTEIPQSMLAAPRGSAPVAPPRQGYRERYQERQVPAAPAAPPVQRFARGDRVSHLAFGSGTRVKRTMPRTDEELVIKFDKVGLKILSGMLAPLTK